jgi:hypothetical protein
MLIITGQLWSIKDGRSRRILPEWVEAYVQDRAKATGTSDESQRANGEGSIFPYRNGFAAYVWVTTPSGKRQHKYIYGRTRGGRPWPLGGAHAESCTRACCHQGADRWAVPPSMARRYGCSESCPAHVRDVREPSKALHRAGHRCPAT